MLCEAEFALDRRAAIRALDGTELAEQIVPFIGNFAKAGGYDVTLLSIIDPEDLDVTDTAGEGVPAGRDFGTGGGDAGMDLER